MKDVAEILSVSLKKAPDESFDFDFKGYGIHHSQCRVDVWKLGNGTRFVLLIDKGMGTSVTNDSEGIATKLVNEKGWRPDQCIFAERYNDRPVEDVDLVSYTWVGMKATDPQWKHLGRLQRE